MQETGGLYIMGLKSAMMLFCNLEKGNFLYFYATIFYNVGQSQHKVLSRQLKNPPKDSEVESVMIRFSWNFTHRFTNDKGIY